MQKGEKGGFTVTDPPGFNTVANVQQPGRQTTAGFCTDLSEHSFGALTHRRITNVTTDH